MVHSLSEIWSAAATRPLWLSSQLTVGKKHPLLRPAHPKAKAPPLAAHPKWHRPISKMTHYQVFIASLDLSDRIGYLLPGDNRNHDRPCSQKLSDLLLKIIPHGSIHCLTCLHPQKTS